MDKQVELKPCPFCGRDGKIEKWQGWFVRCQNTDCGAVFPDYENKETAINMWNTRHPAPLEALDEENVFKVMLDREEKEDGDSHELLLRKSAKAIVNHFSQPAGKRMSVEEMVNIMMPHRPLTGSFNKSAIKEWRNYFTKLATAIHKALEGDK